MGQYGIENKYSKKYYEQLNHTRNSIEQKKIEISEEFKEFKFAENPEI